MCSVAARHFAKPHPSSHRTNGFSTINRGILINLDYVQHIQNASCTMCDSTTFSIHRKNVAAITQAYISHQFKRRTKALTKGGLS